MDKLVALGLERRLENSNFVLESKMVELSQNKNSKQPDRPDVEWKLYFTFGNKSIAHSIWQFTRVLQNRCSKNVRKFLRKVSM